MPEGTEIRWWVRTDRPVTSAEIVRDSSPASQMQLEPDTTGTHGGTTGRGTDTVSASCAYQFRVHWRIGEREYVEVGVTH